MDITTIGNMTIFKFEIKEGEGIEVSNSITQAEDLSFEARGLIVFMLYKQNKGLSMKDFLESHKDGRGSIQKVLKELEEKNYIHKDISKREFKYFLKDWVNQ